MKKFAIYSLMACAALTSCELERMPYGSYPEGNITQDPMEAVDILLNGCYGQLKTTLDYVHEVGEYASDNVLKDKPTTNPLGTYFSYQHEANNGNLGAMWKNLYKVIQQSSNIISTIKPGTSAKLDQKLGEAYFLRGASYFYLCRTFGRPYWDNPQSNLGVPLVNGIPEDLENLTLPDRTTVEKIYQQVRNDLYTATKLMTEETYTSSVTASIYAAQAMLAKVYLYMSGTFENPNTTYADSCYYFADKVIAGPFSLVSNGDFRVYNEIAPDDKKNTEAIWAVKRVQTDFAKDDDYGGTLGSMYATIDGIGWGEIYASDSYLKEVKEFGAAADARANFIRPNYVINEETGEKNPVFRFVTFNENAAATDNQYNYVQLPLESLDATQVVVKEGDKVKETYQLEKIETESVYCWKIKNYQGKDYIGEKDYQMKESGGNPLFYIYKYSMENQKLHLRSHIMLRLGEMYLMRAEAGFKVGKGTPLADVNRVRERSLPGHSYTDTEFTGHEKELIMKERRLEMAFEGDRAYDIFRTNGTVVRHYPGALINSREEISSNDWRAIQLIPQTEINAYPGQLTQNPMK